MLFTGADEIVNDTTFLNRKVFFDFGLFPITHLNIICNRTTLRRLK